MRYLPCAILLVCFASAALADSRDGASASMNLLLNPSFEFHAFTNHRDGRAENYSSRNVAWWNTGAWGASVHLSDITQAGET